MLAVIKEASVDNGVARQTRRDRFVDDFVLEGSGFELLVPLLAEGLRRAQPIGDIGTKNGAIKGQVRYGDVAWGPLPKPVHMRWERSSNPALQRWLPRQLIRWAEAERLAVSRSVAHGRHVDVETRHGDEFIRQINASGELI